MDNKKKPSRQSVRFPSDPNSLAIVRKGEIENIGLVLNESATGCRAVFRLNLAFKTSDIVSITIGPLASLQAEVSWIKPVNELLAEAGFKLLQ